MNKLGLTKVREVERKDIGVTETTYVCDKPLDFEIDDEKRLIINMESLIPDVTLHKTASHRIVLNSRGEIEVVSAMGEVQNLGKAVK